MGTELRTCLVLYILFLDQLGFNFMLGSYASRSTLVMGDNITNVILVYFMFMIA